MKQEITVTDFARGLSNFISRVCYQGEQFVLKKGTRKVAEISPVSKICTVQDFFSFLSKHALSKEEANAFNNDVQRYRKATNSLSSRNPWDV